jgi:AbrB family looped-hinge helix DNA binding protein
MKEAKVTANGRVTIPRAVREHLGVSTGDRIRFFFHPAGEIVARPIVPNVRLKGFAAPPNPQKISIEDMDEAIAASARERNRRR